MAFTPTAAEFDDVELALGGALTEITLALPPHLTGGDASPSSAGGAAAAAVELTDDEGTPVALFQPAAPADAGGGTVEGQRRFRGTVSELRPHESGRFAALRRPAREVAAGLAPATVGIATAAPLTQREVAAVRALAASGTPVLVLGLVGTGRPRPLPADALLRTLTEAAATSAGSPGPASTGAGSPGGAPTSVDLAGPPAAVGATAGAEIRIIAVPLRARPELAGPADDELIRSVARAYGVSDLRRAGELPVPAGAPPELPVLERELRRARAGNGGRGAVVLFTGLSGSGKSTLARGVADALAEDGERTVTLLDGDVVRRNLSAGLGFSRTDRDRNVERIGFVAALVSGHGGIALAAPIAPYSRTRAAVRAAAEAVGDFVLVHVATPIAVCEARDRKGLYARARRGEIPEFTGVSDPYEVPTDADLALDTSTVTVAAGVVAVLDRLRALGHLHPL